MERQVAPLTRDECRRAVGHGRGHIIHDLGGHGVPHQAGARRHEVAVVAGGDQRPRDELRGPETRKKIRQDLVVAWFRQHHVNRPRTVSLLLGVDVLEVLHVLANDKEMVSLLVDRLEARDPLTGARMKDPKTQRRLFSRRDNRWHRLEVHAIVADVERRRGNQRHAADGTTALVARCVFGMHRTDKRHGGVDRQVRRLHSLLHRADHRHEQAYSEEWHQRRSARMDRTIASPHLNLGISKDALTSRRLTCRVSVRVGHHRGRDTDEERAGPIESPARELTREEPAAIGPGSGLSAWSAPVRPLYTP